ncbi:hypothetical protein [Pseudarthrobacter quantipunctorum]|uniref:Uncharacterized protein n=1 Tax=Pseudarthrobacter quantipunctorum TaxID=3128980 RepID=A0ABZ2R899_9MICC
MILTGTITNSDGSYNHIEAEGETYEEARENLYALLDEGQNLIVIRTDLEPAWSRSGRTTSAGDSSGLALSIRKECRKDLPDHAVSAETSTTTGSTSVSAMGSLSLLNLSKAVPFTLVGHECSPTGG